jgi:hypothetical protein
MKREVLAAAGPAGWPPPHKIPPIRIQKLFASSLNGVEVLEAIGGLLEVG